MRAAISARQQETDHLAGRVFPVFDEVRSRSVRDDAGHARRDCEDESKRCSHSASRFTVRIGSVALAESVVARTG